MTNNERETILLIKGAISEMPVEDQNQIQAYIGQIDQMLAENRDCAMLAIALKGAILQAS